MRTVLPIFALLSACSIENNIKLEPQLPVNSVPPVPENPLQEDRFVQQTEPRVDILFVVDNSSSMGDEQLALQENFPRFVDYFVGSGLDWHIGMISTDVQRPDHTGKLRTFSGYRYIDNDTPNPETVFTGMTGTLGVISGSQESGRAAAYNALELRVDEPSNVGFMRDEAELHLIFVSDTNDNSGFNPVGKQEFLQWAAGLKSRPSLVTMHAIVELINDDCTGFGAGRPGFDYLEYAQVTFGITQSICDEDWDPALDALGLQTSGLKQEFFLSRVPVTDPELMLEVWMVRNVDGQDVTINYQVCTPATETEDCEVLYQAGRNSITFLDIVPDPLAEIKANYFIAENFSSGGIEEEL